MKKFKLLRNTATRILVLLIAVLSVAPTVAQDSHQYAIYNYRNDGDFNAWLNIDVDSITYSCFDLDGIEHDDIVVQEVWTPDSLYRIPLEAIDSIGFRAPEPVYKDNVFHIRKYHLPYVLQKEGLVLNLSRQIDKDSIPSVGQIVISDVVEEPLPYGFSGRVLSVEEKSNAYVINCEPVALTDIFERLLLVGRSESYSTEDMRRLRRKSTKNNDDWDGVIPFEVGTYSLNIPSIEGFISNSSSDMTLGTISITPKFCVSYIADIRPFVHSHIKVLFENKSKVSTEMHLKVKDESSVTETKKARVYLTKIPIPLVTGVLYGEVAVSGDLALKGNLDLKATFSKNIYNGDEYEWSTSDFWNISHKRYDEDPNKGNKGDGENNANQLQSNVTFSVNGSFGFGATLELLLFAVSENTLEISNNTTVGPELSGSIKFSSEGLKDGTLYSTLKNTTVSFTPLKLSDEVKFNICMREFTLGSYSKDFGKKDFKLFPDFDPLSVSTNLEYGSMDYNPLGLYTNVKNDVIPIIPLTLGIGRYDNDGNLLEESFSPYFYQYEDEWDRRWLTYDISNLTSGQTHSFYPLIRMWGVKVLQLRGMPQSNISIPKPVSVNLDTPLNSITLPKAASLMIAINDGWGEYSAHSSTGDICDAEIVTVNDKPYVKLTASKYMTGPATITVEDLRSEDTEVILVTVSNDAVPKLAISEQSVSLKENESTTIEITSGSGVYGISDYDDKVVTVTLSGKKIMIEAVGPGTTAITVTDKLSSETKSIEVSVKKTDTPAEPIDLGLPSGTKWASYNVGATAPEEYGSYFAWGETQEKDSYYFTNYSLSDGTVSSCHDIGGDISGTEYDVAHVRWGGDWRMPTKADFQELVYKCECKEDTENGVKGYRFTGPNGKYIFLPYAGYYWDTENGKAGSEGCYWSSTQTTSLNKAHEMSFGNGEVLWDCYINRFAGLSVRPVMCPALPLSVSADAVSMRVGDVSTVDVAGGSGEYGVTNLNSSFAEASLRGSTITINALAAGEAKVVVTDMGTGENVIILVTVTDGPEDNAPEGVEAVDLGLPSGLKWANMNVGANSPEDYGDYFAWGETTPQNSNRYYWDSYKWCNGSKTTMTKYCTNSNYGDNGFTDDKTVLDMEDDAAHANWGGDWRMPTIAEFDELLANTTSEWTTQNGVNGYKFTSNTNGKSIFLPAAGYRWGDELNIAGSYGYYWSSTLDGGHPYDAWYLNFGSGYFGSGYVITSNENRDDGQSVRPVVSDAPVYPDLQVSQTQVNIDKGSSTTVEITSGSGEYGVTNLNSSIARGTLQGTTVTIDGVAVGNDAKIVVTDMQTGQQIIITVSVTASSGTETPGEAVDLGLPSGLKWASMNVGASSPEDYGDYFAWGEVTPQSDNAYSWASYKWCNGSETTLTKYCSDSDCGYNGFTDTKTVLDAEDDAAHANWGGDWRMPTLADFQELIDNTTSEWTTENGVKGRKFTSKTNSNSIFLPAAGDRWKFELYDTGSFGNYWSSTLGESNPHYARCLRFGSGDVGTSNGGRVGGRSVRPVRQN